MRPSQEAVYTAIRALTTIHADAQGRRMFDVTVGGDTYDHAEQVKIGKEIIRDFADNYCRNDRADNNWTRQVNAAHVDLPRKRKPRAPKPPMSQRPVFGTKVERT